MKDAISLIALLGLLAFGVKSCVDSDWHQANERRMAAEKRAERTPHIISEADGCKVYRFKGGDQWHYFTRCAAKTTTDTTIKKSCGKNCTKTEINQIEAQNQ